MSPELEDTRVLLTAAEAYPAFEEKLCAARREVVASFRVFDPFTRLRSEAAQQHGKDWFDLIAAKLKDGVQITLLLSDFDPIGRPSLHRQCWAALRALWAAGEASGRPDLLDARPMLHPARAGHLVRFLFWPLTLSKLRARARQLRERDPVERAAALRESPMLAPLLTEDGTAARIWPPPPLVPASHHQKLAVIDDEWLYIGGLDLNERRFDNTGHERRAEETWHDVQVLTRGAVVQQARQHLLSFGTICAGAGEAASSGGALVRTISARHRRPNLFHLSPRRRITEIEQAMLYGIGGATDLIYLETQFLRSRRIAEALEKAAMRAPDLGLAIVLPGAPEDVAFDGSSGSDARYGEYLQARAVTRIRAAFGSRVFIASPAQPDGVSDVPTSRARLWGAPIIYVHAKVSVFDTKSAIVSSANLNGRSMYWDTEAGVRITDPEVVRGTLARCFEHWSGTAPALSVAAKGVETVARMRAQAERDRALEPDSRAGLLLPYPVEPARRFGRNLPGLPEALV